MEIVYKKVNDLIPYINNSRTHSEEQVNQIVASINEFGFTNPLLIDEKDNIIAGHGRLLASKKLKMDEVPCIVLSGLTEAQKKAYIIADNKMALNAGWDDELLKIELENLKELDFDLDLTGFNVDELDEIVDRITGHSDWYLNLKQVPQDEHLAENQVKEIRCGDNGIFKGVPLTLNEATIGSWARKIYEKYKFDGKYILTDDKFIICQSNAKNEDLYEMFKDKKKNLVINPLGEWTGGTDVDTGATNRKLGSDMAQSVTGGGLHGKDLSKADVSVNIYAFLKAQETGKVVELCCAIGDNTIDGKPYAEIVEIARNYINKIGGFEKFAEWGLF